MTDEGEVKKLIKHQEFINRLRISNPTISLVGEYINYTIPVSVICNLCNYSWYTRPNNIMRGRKCPKCGRFKKHEEFAKELLEKNNKVTLVGVYISVKEKVLVKCKFCHINYYGRPDILLEGMGCSICANKSRRIGQESLLSSLNLLHPTINFLGKPELVNDRVSCNCLVCGKQYTQRAGKLLSGSGCQTCSGVAQRKSHSKFVADVKTIHPNLTILGLYETSKVKLLTKCNKDNHEWYVTPNDLLAGYGCSYCASHGYNPKKEGYFYIYSFLNYCGFGITNTKKQRYSRHRTTFNKLGIESSLQLVVKGTGEDIKKLEKICKTTLPCYSTGIKGFLTEALLKTDSHLLYKLIERYLDFGDIALEKI